MSDTSLVDDMTLVDGVRAFETAAIGALYDKYSDQVFSYCRSMLRHDHDAADATQDTFVRAIERIGQLRDPSKLRPWLFTIARNEAASQGRRRARVRPTETEPIDVGDAPNMTKALSQAELAELMWEAAEGLNDRDRAVLRMQLRAGLSAAEIAAALDVSVEHVRVLQSRMRDRLGRSMSCLLLARHAADDCAELTATLDGWDGTYSARVRERISRHASGCTDCSSRSASMLSPAKLLPVGVIVAAPVVLRSRAIEAMVAAARPRPRGVLAAVAGRGVGAVLVGGAAAAAAVVVAAASMGVPSDPIASPGPGGTGAEGRQPAPVVGAPASDEPRSTRSGDARGPGDGTAAPDGLVVAVGDDPAAPTGPGGSSAGGGAAGGAGACGLVDLNLATVDELLAAVPSLGSGTVGALLAQRPIGSVLDVVDVLTVDQLTSLLSVGACAETESGAGPATDACEGAIDLNTAAAGELGSVLETVDEEVIGRLLATRPLETISDAVTVIGIDPVQLARDIVSGTVCLGPADGGDEVAGGPDGGSGDGSGGLTDVVDGVLDDAAKVVDDVLDDAGEVVDGVADGAGEAVDDVTGGLTSVVSAVPDVVATAPIVGDGSAAEPGPPAPVSSIVDDVVGAVTTVLPGLSNVPTTLPPLTDPLEDVVDGVGDVLSSLTDPLVPTGTSTPGGGLGGLLG